MVRMDEVRWMPDADQGLLSMEVRLNRQPARALRLRLRLWLRDELLSEDIYSISEDSMRRDVQVRSL